LDIEPGTIIAQHYRVQRQLGRGGMGEVFAAENVRTGRVVAVKLLRADTKQKSSAVARFRREARAAGAIHSDYVTQVLDVEEDAEHGIIIVFELLEGESLIDRLKRTGPMSFEEIFPVVEQVWMGLADAHKSGVIHRDLKPSNVFLEKRPDGGYRVKILDFGISKLTKDMSGETLTEMGQNLGTFSFMPPEQIGKAKTVDHRADIYSCATLIYQAMSGQLPYAARNILMIVELKAKAEPRPLSQVMDTPVDPRLEQFLAKSLKRDPEERYQSALEALEAWRALKQPSASQPAPTMQAPVPQQQPQLQQPPPGMYAPPSAVGGQPMQQHRHPSYSGPSPLANIPSVVSADSSSDGGDNIATVAIPMRKVAEALQQRAAQGSAGGGLAGGNPQYAQPRPAAGAPAQSTQLGMGLPRLHDDQAPAGTQIMSKSNASPATPLPGSRMGTMAMPAQPSAPMGPQSGAYPQQTPPPSAVISSGTPGSGGYGQPQYSGAMAPGSAPLTPHGQQAANAARTSTPAGGPGHLGSTTPSAGPSGTARHVPVRVDEPGAGPDVQTAVYRRGDAPTVISARRKKRSPVMLVLGMLAFLILGFAIVMAVVGVVTHKIPFLQ